MTIKWESWMYDLIKDPKKSAKEIAEIIGTTPHAVYQQRSKNGIRVWKKPAIKQAKWPTSKWPRSYKFYRLRVLARDNYTCVYCGKRAETVDHVIPQNYGGSDLPSNLVAACWECNNLKGSSCPDCPRWKQYAAELVCPRKIS
jgi:5-methylcytosine-specific restriction endonuclease McrA